jgi:hypothetical protein
MSRNLILALLILQISGFAGQVNQGPVGIKQKMDNTQPLTVK